MKTKIRLVVDRNHFINFGTADKPDLKAAGDVVECDKKVAERLVEGGFAIYLNEKKGEIVDGE